MLLALADNPEAGAFRDEIFMLAATRDMQAETPDAHLFLERLLAECPGSKLYARSLFLLGWNYIMDGNGEDGAARLQRLVDEYPGDALAARARPMLARLQPKPAPPPESPPEPALMRDTHDEGVF